MSSFGKRDSTNSVCEPESSSWPNVLVMAFCLASLIVGLSIGNFHKVGGTGVEIDFFGAYAGQTEDLLAGQPYTLPWHPPGYTLLLAGTTLLLSVDVFVAGKILNSFATAFFGLITYLLIKSLFSSHIALASTLLLLIGLVPYSFLAATDVVGALGMILPLWVFLRRPFFTSQSCFLTGILAGAAYLIRTQGISVIMGIGFSLLFININQETLRRRLVSLGAFSCGVMLVTTSWFVTNWQIHGHPFASISHAQIAASQYATGKDRGSNITVNQMAERFDSLSDVLLYDPARILRQYLKSITYWNPRALVAEVLQFPAYLFAGAGLILLLSELVRKSEDPTRRWLTFLVVNLFGYLLLGLMMFLLRFYIFLFPLLFLLVAYFLFHSYVSSQIGCIPFTRISNSWLVIVILAVFLGFNSYQETQKSLASDPKYLLDIVEILKKRASPDDRMYSSGYTQLQYLSGLQGAGMLPVANAQEFLEQAQSKGVRYIVYDGGDLTSQLLGTEFLHDPKALPSNFQLIYRHEQTGTLLYEIDRLRPVSRGAVTTINNGDEPVLELKN